MTRSTWLAALAPLALLASVSVSSDVSYPAARAKRPELCQPEGTRCHDLAGRFERRGDRLVFQASDSPQQFVVLENRCLERVDRLIADKGTQLAWSIDGTLTEFRGENLLLLSRATLRDDNRRMPATPPAP